MSTQKRIQRISMITFILMTFWIFASTSFCEASRRKVTLQNTMEASSILQWPLEVNNKIFQVQVNRDEHTIILKGEVDNMEEKMKVEEYMKMKGPSTYEMISELFMEEEKGF